MTRRELLTRAQILLSQQKIPFARLEAELLLRFVLDIDAVGLVTGIDTLVSPEVERQFMALIDRRIKGEPSAYITGHREFYGLDFEVNTKVLIPRPETELLVEKTIEMASRYAAPLVADIGTGSGAIAISVASNLHQAKVYATDVSADALEVAMRNSRKHRVEERITFLQGNLLEPLPQPLNIIVANLPYITTRDLPQVNTYGFEPEMALHGGMDGLDLIEALLLQAKRYLQPGGGVLLEIGLGQKETLFELLRRNNISNDIAFYKDLSGIYRVVFIGFPNS